MEVVPIFPTAIFVHDMQLNEEEQTALLSQSFNIVDSPMTNGELVNDAWTDLSENKQVLRLEELNSIRDKILMYSKKFANEVMGYDVKGMVDVLSWVNEKSGEKEHRTHTHPNSFISGVLYFDNEYDPQEGIVFERHPGTAAVCQLIPKKNHKVINEYANIHYAIPAVKGRLILFPSHQPHFVPKGEPGNKRHSMAFNLMPTGELGDIVALTQFQYLAALTL